MWKFIAIIFSTILICHRVHYNEALDFGDIAASVEMNKGPQIEESDMDDKITGSGKCSMMAGCRVLGGKQGCYGPSGTNQCVHCMSTGKVSKRNIMRADFYNYDRAGLLKCNSGLVNTCPNIAYVDEMMEYMILKGIGVAVFPQGAPFKEMDMPFIDFKRYAAVTFCGEVCIKQLKSTCAGVTLLPYLRNWCFTSFEWIEKKIPTLKGPPSFVLFLAASITTRSNTHLVKDLKKAGVVCYEDESFKVESDCKWPKMEYIVTNEERAAIVAAAASSILLSGRWFSQGKWRFNGPFQELGFAVQHSLWLATYVGRIRVTLNSIAEGDLSKFQYFPGIDTLCDSVQSSAENFQGATGTVYATLCATFPQKKSPLLNKIRFRPEIHVPHTQGCVERTSGMIFIRPGDWIPLQPIMHPMGPPTLPLGALFENINGTVTIEISKSHSFLFPPSVKENSKSSRTTHCLTSVANGPDLHRILSHSNVVGLGGICNWSPSW